MGKNKIECHEAHGEQEDNESKYVCKVSSERERKVTHGDKKHFAIENPRSDLHFTNLACEF